MSRRWTFGQLTALAVCATLTWGLTAARADAAAADLSTYHSYATLTATLQEWAKTHATRMKLVEIGKSRQGRVIWAVEIANPGGVPLDARPALFIGGTFEADQLVGGELALHIIDHLLTNATVEGDVKKRLDAGVFYIVPRLNVDGAEDFFATPRIGRKTNLTPLDDDNDGRVDEDGPEDLNKDGVITVMRVKDPAGLYRVSPDDPRLMARADAARGEAAGYAIYWEGIDNDGDGFINEDGPGGVDLNRNFQHAYPYYAADAGRNMVSEAESRALLEYVLKHRNIAAMLTFGESDNLMTAPTRRGDLAAAAGVDLLAFARQSVASARDGGMFTTAPAGFGGFFGGGGGGVTTDDDGPGPGRGGQGAAAGGRQQQPARRPVTTINAGDIEIFRTVSEKYRALTGIRTAPPLRAPAGAFVDYGYFQFGVPSFITPGWGLPSASDTPTPVVPTPTAITSAVSSSSSSASAPPSPSGVAAQATGAAGERGRGGRGGAGGPGGGAGGGAGAGAGGGSGAGAPAGEGAADAAGIDARLIKWIDAEKIDGFAAWTPFKHPTLGDVEVGGFKPNALSNPPASKLADLGKRHAEFVLYLSSLFPRVSVPTFSVTSYGGGLFRLKAEVENSGYLPTSTAHGVAARAVRPTMVQLGVAPEDIVSGRAKTNFIDALAGSGRRETFEWIVKGKPGQTVTLTVASQKSGKATSTVTLK